MNTYSDYFELDKGYKPEINPCSVKDERWQETFPHETFVALLRRLERMLGRENALAKHSIWIEGAYGTGKSRIAWTLDKLLTCSTEELNAYFDEYEDLRREKDLRTKLLGHKHGLIVTAYRYGSGDINSTEDLVVAVFTSLTEALDKAHIAYDAGKTLRGGLARWLEDGINRQYFDALIKEEPYCHRGYFAGQTASSILTILKGTEKADELVKGTLEVLRKKGINTLPFGMDNLTNWIRETIETAQIQSLIFIWDEFSSFFKNNRTRLDMFQKLVEVSDETPFNLVIVTHYAGHLLPENDQAARIILDRFHPTMEIKMPESIAFQLIGHALKVKPEHTKEWAELADDLNSRMNESRPKVARMLKGVDEMLLKKMLPLQPYAALVLKNIANLFDSNQRSMFNFIKEDTPDLHAFRWYIQEHGPESDEDFILSVDMLWDYFYRTGMGSSGIGKSNLDQMVRSILDVYPREESKLVKDEQRVLKIVLMFQALSKKLGNAPEFLATEENLRLAFDGVASLETGHGISIVNALVKKGILFPDEIAGKKNVYQAPMSIRGRDMEEIEKYKKQKMEQTKTKDLISSFGENLLPLTAALRTRFGKLHLAGPEDFRKMLNSLIAEDAGDYKMKAMLVLARSENDAYSVQTAINDALRDPHANGVVFIDGTATTLSQEDFEKWAEAAAKMSYFAAKDKSQFDNAGKDAEKILQNWEDAISDGSFVIFTAKTPDGIACPCGQDVQRELQDIVRSRFPMVFDFVPNLAEAFFKTAGVVSVQAGVLGGRDKVQKSCVIDAKSEAILLKDVKDVSEYWKKSPDLPLSKLKREIDRMMDKEFAPGGTGRIAIGTIVNMLMRKGFMPTNLSAYLTGFLLKEYAVPAYRYSDGENSDQMNTDRMVNLIDTYFKKLNGTVPRYRECYIEVLTEEQRLFAELAQAVFGLQSNSSIDTIAAQISSRVRDFQYPLWCFKSLSESVGLERFIDKFTLLLNPANASGASSGAIATDIGMLIHDNPTAREKLQGLFSKEKAHEAMSLFLEGFDGGEFQRLAKEIGAIDPMRDVRLCFSTDGVWLWNKEIGEEEIRKVMRDYRIVAISVRSGLVTQNNSLSECLEAWRKKIETLRMPCATLTAGRNDLKTFLNLLLDIGKGGNLEANDRRNAFLQELQEKTTLIVDFFDSRFNLFKSIYKVQLSGLDDEEVEGLYQALDMSSFQQEKSIFENSLATRIEDIKKHQARGKLLDLWRTKTETDTPKEWSLLHKTPALAMISAEAYENAKIVFDALNEKNTPSAQVEKSLEILEKHREMLDVFQQNNADLAFQQKILGRYAVVLKDLPLVRDRLKETLGGNVYGWFGHPELQNVISKLAQTEYNRNCASRLAGKIDKMSPAEAKDYLKRLVLNQLEIGIEILTEN